MPMYGKKSKIQVADSPEKITMRPNSMRISLRFPLSKRAIDQVVHTTPNPTAIAVLLGIWSKNHNKPIPTSTANASHVVM